MAENKTQPTTAAVDGYLAAIEDGERRSDAEALRAAMERLSGQPAVMWGPSIVGFGEYRYCYDSGREGRMARIGFSARAKELAVYIVDGFEKRADLLAKLGRHRTGKSCLYIRRLSEIDRDVLDELLAKSLERMRERYPDGA